MQRSNVVLIGMPGVGKSTVGVLLAKRLGLDFVDTDILIQRNEGRYLREILAHEGIEGFCRIEAGHILTLKGGPMVIATGGSVVYRQETMTHLSAGGTVVFLDLALETLNARLGDLGARGVVCTPGQHLESLKTERDPLYRRYSHITVNCNKLAPDAIVNRIIRALDTGH